MKHFSQYVLSSDEFFVFKINESRYFALFVVSWSIKKIFSIDYVNNYLFSIFFSIDFLSGKVWGYPHGLYHDSLTLINLLKSTKLIYYAHVSLLSDFFSVIISWSMESKFGFLWIMIILNINFNAIPFPWNAPFLVEIFRKFLMNSAGPTQLFWKWGGQVSMIALDSISPRSHHGWRGGARKSFEP